MAPLKVRVHACTHLSHSPLGRDHVAALVRGGDAVGCVLPGHEHTLEVYCSSLDMSSNLVVGNAIAGDPARERLGVCEQGARKTSPWSFLLESRQREAVDGSRFRSHLSQMQRSPSLRQKRRVEIDVRFFVG